VGSKTHADLAVDVENSVGTRVLRGFDVVGIAGGGGDPSGESYLLDRQRRVRSVGNPSEEKAHTIEVD